MLSADDWQKALALVPLPEEGGLYREIYKATERVEHAALPARFDGPRSFSTAIYYMLRDGEFSAFHTVRQDEAWHFYDGAPMRVHDIAPDGRYVVHELGRDGERVPFAWVPAGHHFAAESTGDYSLVGCTVAPGFEFADFALSSRQELVEQFPAQRTVIERLTRG